MAVCSFRVEAVVVERRKQLRAGTSLLRYETPGAVVRAPVFPRQQVHRDARCRRARQAAERRPNRVLPH